MVVRHASPGVAQASPSLVLMLLASSARTIMLPSTAPEVHENVIKDTDNFLVTV
jgi:hypothetical protein